MAANKDFIDILREIRGSGIPGEAYTDGIWYELTIADRNSNPGIYGDILSKYGIIVEHVDTFAQAVSILEKLNVEITTLPAGSEATSALVHGVWQIGIPIGTPGIDGLDGFTPNIAISYTLGKLNCVITVDNVQVVNTTLVNLDELVNTVVNGNVDVQTTLEAKQLIIDSVETVQEIADGLNENVANKIIELSNHTIAKLDELNAASTAEQLEITNTANVEKLAFGQSVTTKVTQYNENHVAKLAEYDANDELKIEQYNSNHTERLENLDEKYATRIIDMLNTNKILGMVDKFAVTTPTQYASFIDTNIGSYIYYLNGHILQNIVDYTVVNDTTIELVTSLSYGDVITQVDSSYIGEYLTFNGVILEERIDQPNGVAGLDENGKLLPGILTQDVNNRFVTDTEKSTWNGKASTSIATTVANGLMSSTDKTKLDDIIGTNTGDQTTISGNAGTATKLQTPRAIQVSGAVTGTADFDGDAAINIVTTNTATPVITLAGDATGSVTLANLSSGTLTVSIVDDSHDHVISNIDGLQTALDAKVDDTEKGVANGIATLDANGKVVLSQINDSILGQLEYKGVWNLATMPTATEKGQYWIASAAGNGYEVGDWAVYNGATFDKVDNTDAVASVAGRTGVVVLTKTDVGLGNVDNTTDATKNVLSATKWTDGRTITIGSTGKLVDGSSNVSWSLAEIGAQAAGSYQPLDATLTALAGVTTAADKMIYSTGADTFTTTTVSSFARTVLDDVDAAAVRTTIGAQALDADLTAIAALAGTSGLLKKTAADTWTLDTNNYVTSSGVTSVTGTAPIVSSGGTTPAISISAATTSAAGSMSAADKAKLDGIATGAQVNVATDLSLGTITTTTIPINSSTGADVSLPAATTSLAGLLSATDKTKLDGIATSANNYVHPTGDGNLHVPATSTTNNDKVLMAGATAGSFAWTALNQSYLQSSGSKHDVDYATVTNIPATLSGLVLTAAAVGVVAIDGYTLAIGNRVLVKNQTDARQNGIYTVTTVGTASVALVFTRAKDANNISNMHGMLVGVRAGLLNTGKLFYGSFATIPGSAPVLGGTNLHWQVVDGSGILDIATAATVNLDVPYSVIRLTSGGTITSFGTASCPGIKRTLITTSSLSISPSASIGIPGSDSGGLSMVPGTVVEVMSTSTTVWTVIGITVNSVSALELSHLNGVLAPIQTQFNGKLSTTGGTLTGALTAVRETKVAMAANAIDLALGNLFTKTIAGNTALTVSNVLASDNANSFILELTNGGAYAITWFSGTKWSGGTAPTLTASGVDILGFYSHNGGTTWRGMVLAKDSK